MISNIPNENMDKITIRKARPDDLDTLLQFEQGVIGAERPYDPTLRPDPLHYYDIPELISADHIELLVAELESGQLIGCGYARIRAVETLPAAPPAILPGLHVCLAGTPRQRRQSRSSPR